MYHRACAILLVFEKITCAYLFQIAWENHVITYRLYTNFILTYTIYM